MLALFMSIASKKMQVLRNRVRLLRQFVAIGVLAGAAAGCSSDFTRFDTGLQASNTQPVSTSANPYSGDVDSTTTASIGGRAGIAAPHPVATVGSADHAGYQPNANSDQSTAMQWSQQGGAPNQGAYDPNYRYQGQDVARADLAAPGQTYPAQNYPAQTYPARTYPAQNTDSVTTSSVRPTPLPQDNTASQAFAKGDTGGVRGWSATGGTTVTLRSGETLYNLSKRYGVPVNALMKANGIADPTQAQAGQKIVVPTYVYGRDVPVSAPDNDTRTRYASAARGALYAPTAENIPVPEPRPRHVASSTQRRDQRAGNNMTQRMASAGPAVDPVVTATTSRAASETPRTADRPTPYVKPSANSAKVENKQVAEVAPARTGIDQFRWPVRGRVISNFGDKVAAGRNDGIDISVPEGTAVKAAENGVVVYSGSELEGFGNLILVRHTGGWVSAYAHNKSLEVARGDEVRRGQIIARSGRSGGAEMPKLHFELRRNSVPLDPIKYLGGA